MNKSLLSMIFILVSYSGFTQPNLDWTKAYGGANSETFTDIKQTADGGYITLGSTTSSDGDVTGFHGGIMSDIWVAKIASTGSLIWQKCLGGSASDAASSIEITTDGGYIIGGQTNSTDGDVSGNHGNADAWVVKLDASGNIIWKKCFGGTLGDYAKNIKQTSDGGYIFVGETNSTDGDVSGKHSRTDIWVVKLNSTGSVTWQKCYGGDSIESSGAIEEVSGGYVFCGATVSNNGDVTSLKGAYDAWVVNINDTGKVMWQKTYGGTKAEGFNSLKHVSNGGYVCVGYTLSSDGDVVGHHDSTDVFVVRIDDTGSLKWAKSLGGTTVDLGYQVSEAADNTYLVAATTGSNDGDVSGLHGSTGKFDMWTMALYQDGSFRWKKVIGGSKDDGATRLIQLVDKSFIASGSTNSVDMDANGAGYHTGTNPNYSDAWLGKLSNVLQISPISTNSNILVYPTVTQNIVHVLLPEEYHNSCITISNSVGQNVWIDKNTGTNRTIDLTNYAAGIYYMKIEDNKANYCYKVTFNP